MKRGKDGVGDRVLLGPPCEHGYQSYTRFCADGHVETGTMVSPELDPSPGRADAYVELDGRGPFARITEEVRCSGRGGSDGPVRSRPATPAYREGWDAIFGSRKKNGGLN